jgi:hypothetical protein
MLFQKDIYNFEFIYFFRGHVQCFELSYCNKIHRVLSGIVMDNDSPQEQIQRSRSGGRGGHALGSRPGEKGVELLARLCKVMSGCAVLLDVTASFLVLFV